MDIEVENYVDKKTIDIVDYVVHYERYYSEDETLTKPSESCEFFKEIGSEVPKTLRELVEQKGIQNIRVITRADNYNEYSKKYDNKEGWIRSDTGWKKLVEEDWNYFKSRESELKILYPYGDVR